MAEWAKAVEGSSDIDRERILRECTMKPTNKTRAPRDVIQTIENLETTEECIAKCIDLVLCDSVNYRPEARECRLYGRGKIFLRESSNDGILKYIKDCPLLDDIRRRRPSEQVICPFKALTSAPAKKYAYKESRMNTQVDKEWYECFLDEMCVAFTLNTVTIYRGNTMYEITFYYNSTTNADEAEGSDMIGYAAKNCSPGEGKCELLTVHHNTTLIGITPYHSNSTTKEYECLKICNSDDDCYAATFSSSTSLSAHNCQLFHPPIGGIAESNLRPDGPSVTWIKDSDQCNDDSSDKTSRNVSIIDMLST